MGAREKLNGIAVWSCLLGSALLGAALESWGAFWGTLALSLAWCCGAGGIRARPANVGRGGGQRTGVLTPAARRDGPAAFETPGVAPLIRGEDTRAGGPGDCIGRPSRWEPQMSRLDRRNRPPRLFRRVPRREIESAELGWLILAIEAGIRLMAWGLSSAWSAAFPGDDMRRGA